MLNALDSAHPRDERGSCRRARAGSGAIRLRDLVRLAEIRWRIEHDYRELKGGLDLDHFEARSWLGWHRHVTLTAVAQAICTQLRRTPQAPAQA